MIFADNSIKTQLTSASLIYTCPKLLLTVPIGISEPKEIERWLNMVSFSQLY